MNQEIIDSYRKAFDELKQTFESIEQQVKDEATQGVSEFMFHNRFDESQAAVVYLKTLLEQIRFNVDFNEIEHSIQEYNRNMEMLRTNTEPFVVPSLNSNTEETKQVPSSEAFNNNANKTKQFSNSEGFLAFVQKQLPNHKFNIIKVDNNNIELEKNKKHYYMTLVESGLQKEEYFEVLERMNHKKNIGFICSDEKNMTHVQEVTKEWVKLSPEYKTKFLAIHFTTKNRLEKNADAFETYKY
ncbi:hypothetical protein R3O67_33190 [Bacillus cereus]|uniref:hypothetical protein n=1 Tax=Bacillus cereus TaxID=1396 RepID=UPI00307A9A01